MDAQLTFMGLDDRRTNGQSKTKPLVLRGEERLKYSFVIIYRDPMSRVGNVDLDVFSIGACRYFDDPPWRSFRSDRVHRINEQVEQHLLQLRRIAGGRRQVRSQSSFDGDPSLDQFAVS